MSDTEVWETWSPQYAPHIEGRYTKRTIRPDGLPDAQTIKVTCKVCAAKCVCQPDFCNCGARWQTACSTGAVRSRIGTFAGLHLHRDPLEIPPSPR